MSKTIVIKLTKGGEGLGPFTLSDVVGNIIATDVPFNELVIGKAFVVEDDLTMIVIESTGKCKFKVTKSLADITVDEYRQTKFQVTYQACSWRHLTDVVHYNFYYNNIEPYIIEYPFSYQYQDEILQNVQDYSKVFTYSKSNLGEFIDSNRIAVDNKYFNKLLIYNDQQATGILKLESKPLNNLRAYNSYPKYNTESKTILYTKSDNFYQINTFWNVVKDNSVRLFLPSCESMSIDKILNQDNMIYTPLSFKKATIRAKDCKIRFILDNESTIHIVSQFIITPAMNSYK